MEYNISNITITIKPWVCNYCTIINTSHPYFCNVCNNQNDIYSVLPEAEDYKQLNKIDRVKNVFGKTTKILLPVLSCYTENQFLDNIDKLYTYFKQKKISGIFLLSTNINIQNFEIMYENAKKIYPDFWMGINLIGFNIFNVFDFIKKYNPDGLWVDNSYLCNINNLGLCELIINLKKIIGKDCILEVLCLNTLLLVIIIMMKLLKLQINIWIY